MRNNQNLKKKLAEDYMYNYLSLVFMASVILTSVQKIGQMLITSLLEYHTRTR